ncbi:MAG: DNA repair protein RecN, partial [Pseudomonadota bacterium]|nr:DNA repair protein RecN [Pseudomonadota bacterium]
MLAALSIRDIVLIEKLDIAFEDGLTVLSGETGAGKSILLDALGLALGARGDGTLVRNGAEKGMVTASFGLSRDHPVLATLAAQGLDGDGDLVVRRVQNADGKSRAFINDQPVSINLLRQVGSRLAEIHGQHDDRALVEVGRHRELLDAFGGLEGQALAVEEAFRAWREAGAALDAHRTLVERARSEQEFIEHALKELEEAAVEGDEEERLAGTRQLMMGAEQFAGIIREARDALAGDGTFEARLNAALRKLERRGAAALGKLDPLAAALDRVLVEWGEAHRAADQAAAAFAFDGAELERVEERLFGLRALARKHKVQVGELPALRARFESELRSLAEGGERLASLASIEAAAATVYREAAGSLSRARTAAAGALDRAVMAEFSPLKLDKARFATLVTGDPERPGSSGIDRVEFTVSANPGTALGPLMKIASGGELARFMLALKAVLAARGSAPTLIFDEIDGGVGGSVADAVGVRLVRLAGGLQVLCVTHSPQVAARAGHHLLISKKEEAGGAAARMVTR